MWKVDVAEVLGRDEIEAAYAVYEASFRDLNSRAVQRHLMTRQEFGAVCVDPGVQKWRGFDDDGDLVALATYTNQLERMTLISPDWYQANYPDAFARRAIWYCGFVCVHPGVPGARTAGAFVELISRMYRQAADDAGIISLDYCRANERLARSVRLILQRVSDQYAREHGQANGFTAACVDEQAFWVYQTAGTPAASVPAQRSAPGALVVPS